MHPIDMLCKEYGLSRYKLAKISGVSENTLSKSVIRNTNFRNLKTGTLINISNALDISTDELINKFLQYEKEVGTK